MTKVYQNNKNFVLNFTNSELDEFKSGIIQNVELSFNSLANMTFEFVQFLNGTTESKFAVILINISFSGKSNSKIFKLKYYLKTFPSFLRLSSFFFC